MLTCIFKIRKVNCFIDKSFLPKLNAGLSNNNSKYFLIILYEEKNLKKHQFIESTRFKMSRQLIQGNVNFLMVTGSNILKTNPKYYLKTL